MNATDSQPDTQSSDPTLRIGLIVVVGVAVLGLALMVGAGIGRRRAEEEGNNDPIAALEQERQTLEGEALALAPPLHGRGERTPAEAIDAIEKRHQDLVERARLAGLPLETSQIEAVVARARFEGCLARGGSEAFAEATLLLRRVGHRGEEPVLRARLELAQGKEPDVSWLASWTDVEDPAVAEAARLLSASLYAAREPDRARRLVSTRVDERLAKEVLARIDLASAARSLDPNSVRFQISTAGRDVAEAPRLRREVAQVGLREGTATIPSYQKVERVLRVVGLLRGQIGSDGERLARVAFVVARRCLVELGAGPPLGEEAAAERRAAKVTVLLGLLAAVAESGLRSGPCAEAGSFLDDLLGPRAPAEASVRLAGSLAACRLDARLHPVHLAALEGSVAELTRSTEPVLRALALRLGSEAPQPGAVQPLESSLPPVQLSQLLLAAQAALPAGPDRLALCVRALELDSESPGAALAVLAAGSEAPPAGATTKLAAQIEVLTKERPLLRSRGHELLKALARLQEGWAQGAAAQATLDLAQERYGPE
tara:strand:- start:591 stop:2222 length:1632 start_codon:yes stop_codon:yes gene_type:complete